MSNRFDDMFVQGINTNDATATATDIVSGKTAYAGGHKITGTLSPGGGSDNWNVFLQNSEPQSKNGVWIKTNGSANPSVYFSTDFSAKGDFINSSILNYMNGFNSQTQVIIGNYMYSFSYYTYGAIKYDLKNKRVVERFTMPNTGTTLTHVYACEYNSEIHIFTFRNSAYFEYYKYYPSTGTFSEVTVLSSINMTDPYCFFFAQINNYVYLYKYSYYNGRDSSGVLQKISLETGTLTGVSNNPFQGVYKYNNYAYKRESVATTGNLVFLLDSIYSTQYPTDPYYNKIQLIKADLSVETTGIAIQGVPAFGRIYASGNFLYLFPVGTNNNYYIYDINNDTWKSMSTNNSYTINTISGYFAGDYTCFDYSSGIVYIRTGSNMLGFQVAESPEAQDLDVGTVVIGETLDKRITKIQDSSNIHVGVYDTYVVRTENDNKYLDGSQTSFYGDGLKWSLIKNPSGETCVLSFNSDGGSSVPSQTVIIGQTGTEPAQPTKSGYVFDYWKLNDQEYDFSTPMTSNITLTAKWLESITVTFNDGNGNITTQEVLEGNTLEKPATPSSSTEVFKYWTLNGTEFDFTTPITAPITLIAEWDTFDEVEYIQSTGTQYIDTGYKPNRNTEVVTEGFLNASVSNGYMFGIGLYGKYVSFAIRNNGNTNNYMARIRSGSSSNETIDSNVSCDTTSHLFRLNKTGFYIDGNTIGTFSTTYEFTEDYNMYIFGWDTQGTVGSMTNSRVYSFKVYDNGTLVRDFQPIKTSNGVYCLFDKVENKAYYNAGTGTFIGGGIVE